MEQNHQTFYALLRSAITGEICEVEPSEEEWIALYHITKQQSLTGVLWSVVKERRLPEDLAMQWTGEAETIRGLNALLNEKAAQLTQLFASQGHKTAILKGQANARLYPDRLNRQPGDIDIWVEGGRKQVIALLDKLGMMPEKRELSTSYHHVHLPASKDGIVVEVHFRPSSGVYDPLKNRRLQRWLEQEIQTTTMTEQGFHVPTIRFALVMQLAHIQRHFFSEGVGLRQLCDYYWLLHASTESDRKMVSALLSSFGLKEMAGALMWLLHQVLHLDEKLMLCEQDSTRGNWMLHDVVIGGNFGHYAQRQGFGLWRRVYENKRRNLQLMRFNFEEPFWVEVVYWTRIIRTLHIRIKYRTLSLRDFQP